MRKDRVYRLCMALNIDSMDILGAECGCPGGKGPTASCKHIVALCYTFKNFCEQGIIPNFLTCTEKLQQWNKPCKRNLDPIPVTDFQEHQKTIARPCQKSRCPRTPLTFDLRTPTLWQSDTKAVEKLRTDLVNIHPHVHFLVY